MANMDFYEAWEEAERQERETAAESAASSSQPKKKRKLPEPVNATHDPYQVMEESSSSDSEQEKQEESSSSDLSSTEDTSSPDEAVADLETKNNSPSESRASGVKGAETEFDDDVPLKVTVMAATEQDVKRQRRTEGEEQQAVKDEKEEEKQVDKKSAMLLEEQQVDSEKLLEGITNALLSQAVGSKQEVEQRVQGSQGKWGKPPGPVPVPPAEVAPPSAKCGAVPKAMPTPVPWRRDDVIAEPMASAPAPPLAQPPLPPPPGPPPVDGSERPRSPSQPPRDDRPRGPAGPQHEGYYYTFFSSRREYERLVRNQFRSRRGRNQRS